MLPTSVFGRDPSFSLFSNRPTYFRNIIPEKDILVNFISTKDPSVSTIAATEPVKKKKKKAQFTKVVNEAILNPRAKKLHSLRKAIKQKRASTALPPYIVQVLDKRTEKPLRVLSPYGVNVCSAVYPHGNYPGDYPWMTHGSEQRDKNKMVTKLSSMKIFTDEEKEEKIPANPEPDSAPPVAVNLIEEMNEAAQKKRKRGDKEEDQGSDDEEEGTSSLTDRERKETEGKEMYRFALWVRRAQVYIVTKILENDELSENWRATIQKELEETITKEMQTILQIPPESRTSSQRRIFRQHQEFWTLDKVVKGRKIWKRTDVPLKIAKEYYINRMLRDNMRRCPLVKEDETTEECELVSFTRFAWRRKTGTDVLSAEATAVEREQYARGFVANDIPLYKVDGSLVPRADRMLSTGDVTSIEFTFGVPYDCTKPVANEYGLWFRLEQLQFFYYGRANIQARQTSNVVMPSEAPPVISTAEDTYVSREAQLILQENYLTQSLTKGTEPQNVYTESQVDGMQAEAPISSIQDSLVFKACSASY